MEASCIANSDNYLKAANTFGILLQPLCHQEFRSLLASSISLEVSTPGMCLPGSTAGLKDKKVLMAG